MQNNNLTSEIVNATKWSAITNVMRKLISPVVSMILARLLTPDAFGVVATVNIVISLAETLSDAGFSKYMVQFEFEDQKALYRSANIAFWSNFSVSMVMWWGIVLFRDMLAEVVGSPGYGFHLAVAACSIPIVALSSIQQAVFRRSFDFKGMFLPRLINSLIPLIVTVPIAYVIKNCWALIIGTLISNLSDAVLLTVKSKWKPSIYYRFGLLKKMLSFSVWSLLEAIAIWLTLNADVFILGRILSSYYLGLYKTSLTTVNQVVNLITTTIIPVLFASLSRCQSDRALFQKTFYDFQKMCAVILIPMSIGMFLYGDVLTWVLLGNQWMEASRLVSLHALVQAFVILFSNFASAVYRSLGEPKVSFSVQVIYILCVCPVLYVCGNISFEVLCIAKICLQLWFFIMNLSVMQFRYKISIKKMFSNISAPVAASMIMALFAVIVRNVSDSMIYRLISIIPCVIVYTASCLLFRDTRSTIVTVWNEAKKKMKR